MSSESRVTPVTVVYPFGLVALTFALISMFATTLFSHPDNDPTVVIMTSYLWTLGIMAMILIAFVLIFSTHIDRRAIMDQQYNPIGMWAAFLLGLGGLAFLKNISPAMNPFSSLSIQLSSLQIDTTLFMFMVATIEELMFRVGIAMAVYKFYPSKSSFTKLAVAAIVSNILFAVWHWFAYGADPLMMCIAFGAGFLLTLGYQLGAQFQGGDTAFIGIVCGHWLWNISFTGGLEPVITVVLFLGVVTLLTLLVNRYAMYLLISFIKRIFGGR